MSDLADWRNDGALLDAISAVGNAQTGLGTGRDRTQYAEVNLSPQMLTKAELEALYRSSRICEKAVRLLPEGAIKKWCQFSLGHSVAEGQAIAQYQKRLHVRKNFADAGLLGRLYGDGFIILGVDDGQPFDQPVDETKIRSVRWLKSLSRWHLQPDLTLRFANADTPNHYLFNTTLIGLPDVAEGAKTATRRIHQSRVLRFPGKRLPVDMVQLSGGYHDSVIQGMWAALSAYLQAMQSTSAQIQDHNLFLYKLKGLAALITRGDSDALLKRFTGIQMGMSVIKGLMMDADTEDAQFVSRNFAGLKDLLGELLDAAIAAADMPRSKVLGSTKQGSFSEAGKSERYEWAAAIATYQANYWQEPLETLTRYCLLAKDGPTRGREPDGWGIEWLNTLQLTEEEQATLEKMHAERDRIYLISGVLRPEEVRESRFGGPEYGISITLDDAPAPAPEPEEARADAEALQVGDRVSWDYAGGSGIGTVAAIHPRRVQRTIEGSRVIRNGTADNPAIEIRQQGGGKLLKLASEVSNARQLSLDQIRADALAGLLPLSEYQVAAGYNPEAIEAELDAEFRQQSAPQAQQLEMWEEKL